MSVRRIAELAGVSPSTVSLALKKSPKIQEATRRRVEEVARRLGYSPNTKVTELMSHVRMSRVPHLDSCFAVISFYEEARPWESSVHLQRMYESMLNRAENLGYRLEPMWLRSSGMTHRRFRGILDARGIEGMLCFGSPDVDEAFPAELDHYAIVTQGVSIKTSLHRVITHAAGDMWRTLEMVYGLGYRHPGVIIGQYEEERSAHAYMSACLGWCQQKFGEPALVPILTFTRLEEQPLLDWLEARSPDVVVFVDRPEVLAEFSVLLQRHGIRWPNDMGVAAITQTLEGTDFSGFQENQRLIGAWAVELLVDRIMNHDLGIPENPRILMVESQWIKGSSLRLKLE
ncbi:MAG: LacI family DNA-binding transcriptional regulator [Opitutaceae bacterium]